MNKEFKIGDNVRGSWRDEATGKTYYQEGKIIHHPETGFWVESQPDGGITPLKSFFSINTYNPNKPLTQTQTKTMNKDILSEHKKLRNEYKEQKGFGIDAPLDKTGYILWLENKVLNSNKE